MKVKTNLRAGAGKQKRNSSDTGVEVEVQSPPPVSRCVGI